MLEKYKIDRQIEADLMKAQIAAGAQVKAAYKKQTGSEDPEGDELKKKQAEERENNRDMALSEVVSAIREMMEEAASPVIFERDKTGKVAAITKGKRKRMVARGPDGGIAGVQ